MPADSASKAYLLVDGTTSSTVQARSINADSSLECFELDKVIRDDVKLMALLRDGGVAELATSCRTRMLTRK